VEALSTFTDILVDNATILVPAMAVFIRLSALIYLLPGIGEAAIPVRIRLAIAFGISLLLIPIVTPDYSGVVFEVSDVAVLLVMEAIYGLLLGFAFRMLVFTLQILGNIVSQALSISQVLGEGIATEPNTTISTLLMITGTALIVSMDLHVQAFGILLQSYEMFPLGAAPDLDKLAYWIAHKAMDAFSLGVSLALPFIILNFVYNLILGFLNRAMPQLMVSFVGMPAITGAGLFLMVVATGGMLTAWSTFYFQSFEGFAGLAG